jgi:hypothetical protein
MDLEPRKYIQQAIFRGLEGPGIYVGDPVGLPRYPYWLYKDGYEPILVNCKEEVDEAKAKGYELVTAGTMANKNLINWFWDLEDFSPKQLRVFAKDEYGVELPEEASQQTLFKAVTELSRAAPQNRNRTVMMAHTISMNYDATIEEIKRMAENHGDCNVEQFYEEFEA